MPRVQLPLQQQKALLDVAQQRSGLSLGGFAQLLSVHTRTVSDWRRDKFFMTEDAYQKCLRLIGDQSTEFPAPRILPDRWHISMAAQKGGRALAAKYGGPGTPAGRRKGGRISQLRRRKNPEKYQHCKIRKTIKHPRPSRKLAECIGILLGDGCIQSPWQLTVSLNSIADKTYAVHVAQLFYRLFGVQSTLRIRPEKHTAIVTCSSRNLVEFFLRQGLVVGDKIRQRVGVPGWIMKNPAYARACVRGLIDTDGCIYFHHHKVAGYAYIDIGLNFANKAENVLHFVHTTFLHHEFNVRVGHRRDSLFLYGQKKVEQYLSVIGSSNDRIRTKHARWLILHEKAKRERQKQRAETRRLK